MKKWFWAAPAAVFLVSLVIVLYLNAKDVSPGLLIGADKGPSWPTLSETEALSLLEKNWQAFTDWQTADDDAPLPEGVLRQENGMFILDEIQGGFVQALLPQGTVFPVDASLLNGWLYLRALPLEGWTYGVSYPLPLTQSGRYVALVSPHLQGKQAKPAETWVLVLAETENEAFPAERSKSAYVVKLFIPLENGDGIAAYVDPKQYAFLGFIE